MVLDHWLSNRFCRKRIRFREGVSAHPVGETPHWDAPDLIKQPRDNLSLESRLRPISIRSMIVS